jgi:surface antigen
MIAIAVAASLIAYAWIMGYIGGTTTKVGKAVLIQSMAPDDVGNLVVYVQNVGMGSVTIDSVYVNDNLILQGLGVQLPEGQTATVLTSFLVPQDTQLKVKVVTTDGTFTEKSGSVTSTVSVTQYQVDFALGSGGSSMSPSGSQSYAAGTIVAISATPDFTHTFSQWTADTGSITFDDPNAASTNAHINGAGTITANFAVIQQVTFVSAGAPSNANGPNGNPTPGYPSGLQANDLILLQVVVRGDPTTTITPPAGFNILFGPDPTGTGAARVTQWIYYKFAVGTESGTATVTISQPSGIYGRGAMMYAFRNVALTSFTEDADINTAYSSTISPPSVTTLGVKRLAVSFEALAGDPEGSLGLNSFTGESGGDWTLAAAYNVYHGTAWEHHFENGLQTATMASAGTISGGSDNIASYPWVVRSFALIPR